jgi:hypothetical protein
LAKGKLRRCKRKNRGKPPAKEKWQTAKERDRRAKKKCGEGVTRRRKSDRGKKRSAKESDRRAKEKKTPKRRRRKKVDRLKGKSTIGEMGEENSGREGKISDVHGEGKKKS